MVHIYLYSQLKTDNERLMAVVDGYEINLVDWWN